MEAHGHLVAIPYPGRGHINPMISLCQLLASRGLLITVVVTDEWLHLLSSSPLISDTIRLRSIPNVVPSEKTRGADFLAFVMAVLTKMEAPVEDLIQGLDVPADAIVADSLLPWAPEVGKRRGIPVSAVFPQSATMFLALHQFSSIQDHEQQSSVDLIMTGKRSECLDYLPRNSSTRIPDFMATSTGQTAQKSFIQAISWSNTAHSLLFTSFYELESQVIDTLRSKLRLPIYAIGPSIPHMTLNGTPTASTVAYSDWLDRQPTTSVLYVSLGSFLPVSATQMDEIAAGLQMSGVRFLWAAREESGRIKEYLSSELGLVVPWSDQLRVLCHSSVGGFLTHCGWNSTLEGMYAGVPMLTFPLMWDQFPNSKLVVDEWEVGMSFDAECVGGFVGREAIAKVVRKFMDLDWEESKEMRRRARELKEMCSKALEEKGSSSISIHAIVQDIVEREKKMV